MQLNDSLSNNSNTSAKDILRVSTPKVYINVIQYEHTEMITGITVYLPKRPAQDEFAVKVDSCAESNVVPRRV